MRPMLRCSCIGISCLAMMLAFAVACSAQPPQTTPTDQASLTKILGLKKDQGGEKPGGCFKNPPATVFTDDKIVHSGHWSVRIERDAQRAGQFSAISRSISWEFWGKTT